MSKITRKGQGGFREERGSFLAERGTREEPEAGERGKGLNHTAFFLKGAGSVQVDIFYKYFYYLSRN